MSWTNWETVAENAHSGPAVASMAPGRTDLFFLRDRNLVQMYWDGAETGTETHTDRLLYSQPAAVSWGLGRIDLFVRDKNSGRLLHKWLSDGKWYPWEDLGGNLKSDPSVASTGVNRLDVFAQGYEGVLLHREWDGSTWKPWVQYAGPAGGLGPGPAAVSWGPGRVDVVGIDSIPYRQVVHQWRQGNTWGTSWEYLIKRAARPVDDAEPRGVSIASWAEGRLDVFSREPQGAALEHTWYAGGWGTEELPLPTKIVNGSTEPEPAVGAPAAISRAPDSVECFVTLGNRKVVRIAWPAPPEGMVYDEALRPLLDPVPTIPPDRAQ